MLRRLPEPLPVAQCVRLHGRRGHYPAKSVYTPDARLIFQDGLVFSIVRVEDQERHGITAERFSEQAYLALEEVRFFAAISMTLQPERGVFYTYPLSIHKLVPPDTAYPELLHLAHELDKGGGDTDNEYRHHESTVAGDLIQKYLEAIDLQDHLVMRGLGAIVSAQMLSTHNEFLEAATTMLFIAMEVSLQLIKARIEATGKTKVTQEDAGLYLDKIFDQEGILRPPGYFAESWALRVAALHPNTAGGPFPFPPLEADDYYFLRDWLIELFAYLTIGHKWGGYE